MEPARSTEGFSRRITVADANNIVTVLDLNQVNSEYQIFAEDYLVKFQVALEDLKITVGLSSLSPAPYPNVNALMSDAQQQAEIAKLRTEGQKIALGLYTARGNGPWQYESEVVLMNQGGETHVPILVPFLSTNETLLVGGEFKLGVKIEPKWNQPLKVNDYLVIRGTYKQIVSFSSKKKDDINELKARIETLELALEGRLTNLPPNSLLGRDSGAGIVQNIPQSTFAKNSDLNAHTSAPDPHPNYLLPTEGDTRYLSIGGKASDAGLIDGIGSSRIVFGESWHKANGAYLTTNGVFSTSGFIDCYSGVNSVDNIYPPGMNHIHGFQARHGNSSSFWGLQVAGQHNIPDELYFRTIDAGAFNQWNRIWNNGNLPFQYPTPALYGSLQIPGSKNGYAGISFQDCVDGSILMFGTSADTVFGVFKSAGWIFLYDRGNFSVFSPNVPTEGSFLGLYKGLGSLPGFASNQYPTVRTDANALYFSIGGVYSAAMSQNGVLTAVSDRNKKENLQECDDIEILELLKNIPIYTYNFKNSNTRIRNMSCMAQDFYAAFGLGGDEEIDADDSPTNPSKMLAPADAIGVCMASIKGVAQEVQRLKSMIVRQ
jgi:Chaperone of endosialidase